MSPPKRKPSVRKFGKKNTGTRKQINRAPKKKKGDSDNSTTEIRIHKFLASAGIGSRRHCEEYVETGRVTVDGKVVSDLSCIIDPTIQKIKLDGELVRVQPKRYYILNKPAGYLCTNKDPTGRALAVDLIRQETCRLFTVGRLDENSTGLIIVTNDGDLAHRLAHPKFQIPRQYRVQVVGKPTKEALSSIQKGLYFSDGRFRVRGIKKVSTQGKSTFLELTLTEGQNREIRRMMARIGHKVISLQRVGFASIKLGRLALGKSRQLKPAELKSLIEYIEIGEARLKENRKNPQANRKPFSKNKPEEKKETKDKKTKRTYTKRAGTKKTTDKRSSTSAERQDYSTNEGTLRESRTHDKKSGRKRTYSKKTDEESTGGKRTYTKRSSQSKSTIGIKKKASVKDSSETKKSSKTKGARLGRKSFSSIKSKPTKKKSNKNKSKKK